MKIEKFEGKVKCDASGCNSLCSFRILNKKFVFVGSFYLCENCLQELYEMLNKIVMPKSPQPIFKKKGVKDEQI